VCPVVSLDAVKKRKILHCNDSPCTSETMVSNCRIINKLLIGKVRYNLRHYKNFPGRIEEKHDVLVSLVSISETC
jgi:hypothetical protein